ncbi:hypothetical protein PG993_012528 [Apiospora rasikravindrae]|uniref:Uncharacterized protein n=1 Tax=Apiospora rasikravindrae TaxID=990691 RepID=A0ABR1S2L8_9PEZI
MYILKVPDEVDREALPWGHAVSRYRPECQEGTDAGHGNFSIVRYLLHECDVDTSGADDVADFSSARGG